LERYYFIGDLFPLLMCFFLGFIMSAEFFIKAFSKNYDEDIEPGILAFANSVKPISGIIAIIIALIHNFLFNYTLF